MLLLFVVVIAVVVVVLSSPNQKKKHKTANAGRSFSKKFRNPLPGPVHSGCGLLLVSCPLHGMQMNVQHLAQANYSFYSF